MRTRPCTHLLAAAGTSALVVASLVLSWAAPAAAILPIVSGPTTVPVTTNAIVTLTGSGAPQVIDPDTSGLAVELTIGGPAVGRPTFTLDGTAGLTVAGSTVRTRSVGIAGTKSAINAALDGMRIEGGAPSLDYTLTVVADESPTAAGGTTTKVIDIEQRGTRPQNAMPPSFTVGTRVARTLAGAGAIQVADVDSPVLELDLAIIPQAGSASVPSEEWPTFSVDGTAGLTVTGEVFDSTTLRVSGAIADLNAALDGMVITGGTTGGGFHLVVTTGDVVGNDADDGDLTDTDRIEILVTSQRPVNGLPANLSVGTSADRVLGPITVSDPDSPTLDVLLHVQQRSPGATLTRPTFTLPTTAGLLVAGVTTATTAVRLIGSVSDLNAALGAVVLHGPPNTGEFDLVLETDDRPELSGPGGNTDVDLRLITVTGSAPTATAGPDLTLGTAVTRQLGSSAPSVADADDDRVEVALLIARSPGDVTSVRPTFTFPTTDLAVTAGSATGSSSVIVAGPPAAIDAALEQMAITAGSSPTTFILVVAVDEAVGAPTGQVSSDNAIITVTADPPVVTAGTPMTLASFTSSPPLRGAAAPQVGDPDSPVVDVEVTIFSSVILPSSNHPTFTLDGTAGLTVVSGTAVASRVVALQGSPAAVNAALDGMVVRAGPASGQFGVVVAVDDVPGAGGTPHAAITIVNVTDASPTVTVPGSALRSYPGQTGDAPVTVGDGDSPELEARVRVLGTTAGRPQVRVTAPAGLVVDAGPATGTVDLQVHGAKADVISALASLRAIAGTATGTFTVEVTVDDARPEVGNTVTRTFTVVVEPGPSAPTAVSARARAGGITVTWEPPSSPGPNALTGYRVRVLRGTTQIATVDVDPTVRARAVDGLANGTAVTVEVRALTALGAGVAATAGPVTPQVFAPFASAGAMVDRLYLDLVGRAPTASERTTAVNRLGAGTLTPAGLVAQLRGSADGTGNVDPVTRLYRAYFLRIPDQAGLDFWIARRRSGQSLNQISQSFAQSPEFRTLYGSLSNREFVELVYENVLGRPGEAGGVAFWTGQLDSGARTRGQVMTGFSESPEYRGQQRAEVDVSVAHILLLDRSPTAVEHAADVAGIEAGTLTVALLHARILASEEYEARVT